MVASEYAETPGIIRDRFVKTKFGREIGDRILDRAAGSRLSISVVASEISLEFLKDLLSARAERFCPVQALPAWIAAKAEAFGRDCDWSGSKARDPNGETAGARRVPMSTTD